MEGALRVAYRYAGLATVLSCAAPADTGTPAPQVNTVEVSPLSATLTNVGATQQFTATARDAANTTMTGQTFTWSSSNTAVATVSNSGMATAAANGTTTITASTGGKQATAALTVSISTGPAPVTLFEETFENASLASRGWYDLPGGGITSITTSEHIPGSSSSLQIHLPQGATGPNPQAGGRHLFTEQDRIYLRYWVKYSANWVGSGRPYQPHEIYFVTNRDTDFVGPAYTFLTTYVEHNYQNGGIAVLRAQDSKNIDVSRINQDLTAITENRSVAGCNGASDGTTGECYQSGGTWRNGKQWQSAQPVFAPSAGPGYKNDWHKVEVLFGMNTIQNGRGQLDGIAQYWFDGQLVIDRRNVLLRTAAQPTMRFEQFILAVYIGDGAPVAQTMWIDDLIVMTGRP